MQIEIAEHASADRAKRADSVHDREGEAQGRRLALA